MEFTNDQGYVATIIADSISPTGKRITTFELTYPRMVHSEMMTHRLFSRNAASSRAIPVTKLIELIRTKPARPYRFGQNQPGMQDKGVDFDAPIQAGYSAQEWWDLAALSAIRFAEEYTAAGYHKQVANRLLEPFQFIKTVLTATEFANFWWLRIDADADPSIKAIAELMKQAIDVSKPEALEPGQWHTPYVDHAYEHLTDDGPGIFVGYCLQNEDGTTTMLTEQEALAISSSCCAQVSYRVLNNTKDKALDIYGKLLSGAKVHASPFEHQATPMIIESVECFGDFSRFLDGDLSGYTHVDKNGMFWSGNLQGFVQHRQLLENHSEW